MVGFLHLQTSSFTLCIGLMFSRKKESQANYFLKNVQVISPLPSASHLTAKQPHFRHPLFHPFPSVRTWVLFPLSHPCTSSHLTVWKLGQLFQFVSCRLGTFSHFCFCFGLVLTCSSFRSALVQGLCTHLGSFSGAGLFPSPSGWGRKLQPRCCFHCLLASPWGLSSSASWHQLASG